MIAENVVAKEAVVGGLAGEFDAGGFELLADGCQSHSEYGIDECVLFRISDKFLYVIAGDIPYCKLPEIARIAAAWLYIAVRHYKKYVARTLAAVFLKPFTVPRVFQVPRPADRR